MSALSAQPSMRRAGATLERSILHAFPTPRFLLPPAAGIDISDASIKWMALSGEGRQRRVEAFGMLPLEKGIVSEGVIKDHDKLAAALAEVKHKLGGIEYAHAALPEEEAYVFSMHVPEGSPRQQCISLIEFGFEERVPIPPTSAVYDFDTISERDGEGGMEIGVMVFPRDLSESYADAFRAAGITLVSLEIEARSIGRAVTAGASDGSVTLMVDFGRDRTGFAILKRGVPIFTSTVAVGGEGVTRALMQSLSVSVDEADLFKNTQGLLAEAGPKSPGVEALSGTASALGDEVARHFHYWDTRRNEHGERSTPVERVVLVGGSSNLKGLPDYLASRIQAPVEVGDIWQNICSFDEYIPPLDKRTSLQYATAAGLALRSF